MIDIEEVVESLDSGNWLCYIKTRHLHDNITRHDTVTTMYTSYVKLFILSLSRIAHFLLHIVSTFVNVISQ